MSDGRESVKVINTQNLRESLGNEMGLLSNDISVSVFLCSKDPFLSYNVGTSRWSDQDPSASISDRGKFLFNSLLPI